MTGPTVVMQRLRRAWDEYEMSEGFAAVLCVLTVIILYLSATAVFGGIGVTVGNLLR